MRIFDLVALILIAITVILQVFTFAEVAKKPEVKYVVTEKVVQVVVSPTATPAEKPATVSGKIK